MNRLLVFALVASLGNASMAFAGESILKSGARHAQELAVAESVGSSVTSPASPTVISTAPRPAAAASAFQGETGNLSRSGMSKGLKAAIYIGLAVGFAASVWTIDHRVQDNTPSSLGTRKD